MTVRLCRQDLTIGNEIQGFVRLRYLENSGLAQCTFWRILDIGPGLLLIQGFEHSRTWATMPVHSRASTAATALCASSWKYSQAARYLQTEICTGQHRNEAGVLQTVFEDPI